jgi:hypothetical protein
MKVPRVVATSLRALDDKNGSTLLVPFVRRCLPGLSLLFALVTGWGGDSSLARVHPTPAASTPTATETMTGAVCGNGILERGENFADPEFDLIGDPDGTSCPADAVVKPCTRSDRRIRFDVSLAYPPATFPTTAVVLIGYRSDLVSLPGRGFDPQLRRSITAPPPLPNVFTQADFDYAVRVTLSRSSGLAEGLLVTVTFDTCDGAATPSADQLACTVEGCASGGGPIDGCTCALRATSE